MKTFAFFAFDFLATLLLRIAPEDAEWRVEGCLVQLSNILSRGEWDWALDSRREVRRLVWKAFGIFGLVLVLLLLVVLIVVFWTELLEFGFGLVPTEEFAPALEMSVAGCTLVRFVQGELFQPRPVVVSLDCSWEGRLAQMREEARCRAEDTARVWMEENGFLDLGGDESLAVSVARHEADTYFCESVRDDAVWDTVEDFYADSRLAVEERLDGLM